MLTHISWQVRKHDYLGKKNVLAINFDFIICNN